MSCRLYLLALALAAFAGNAGAQSISVEPLAPPSEQQSDDSASELPAIEGGVQLDTSPAEGEANAETDDDAAKWRRARARRFRLVPRGSESGELDYNPTPVVPIARIETELMAGAELRKLDKMTGKTEEFALRAGEERQVDRLRVKLDACRAPVDRTFYGTMAFLSVWDMKNDDEDAVFNGWMFAESPALSSMDHPRYDVWVIRCSTASTEESTSSE